MPVDVNIIIKHVRSDLYEDFVHETLGHIQEPDNDERIKRFYGPLFFKKAQRKKFFFVEGDKLLLRLIFNVIKKFNNHQNFWEMPAELSPVSPNKQRNRQLVVDFEVETIIIKHKLQKAMEKWGLTEDIIKIDIYEINFDDTGIYADLECKACTARNTRKNPNDGDKHYLRRIRKITKNGKNYWNFYSIDKHLEKDHDFDEEYGVQSEEDGDQLEEDDDNNNEEVEGTEPEPQKRSYSEAGGNLKYCFLTSKDVIFYLKHSF